MIHKNLMSKFLAEANLQDKIVNFLKNKPNPDDSHVHDFADELGISPHDLETEIYKLATLAAKDKK